MGWGIFDLFCSFDPDLDPMVQRLNNDVVVQSLPAADCTH